MEWKQLSKIMRGAGIVGAGGAGFPSYAKLNTAADTVILNCAECEPLFRLHRQLLARYAKEIVDTLCQIADAVGASAAVVAVKRSYTNAVEAVENCLNAYPKLRIAYLSEFYPAGDELITVYEATGRTVAPGALPISVGCIVYNVETVYNVYRALTQNAPVTHKYVTVTGEVQNPCTLYAPIGITYGELIKMVGGATRNDTVIIAGGPMTGRISSPSDVVTKTSNAVLVLPKNAYVVQKRLTPISIRSKRAMSACCQCRMCTDLCSRHLMGHPIEPHKIMQAVATGVATDSDAFLSAFSCSSCGLCEMYACGQGLDPRSIIDEVKSELRKNGIAPPRGTVGKGVDATREYRKVSLTRLIARLGLRKYDVDAPMLDVTVGSKRLKIRLGQGIGAASVPCVSVGERVAAGQLLADFDENKLGTAVHAPLDGVVTAIDDTFMILDVETKL